MTALGANNFDYFNNQAFFYVLDELPKFHKFIYKSQRDLKTLLKCTVLLYYAPVNQDVDIVCDVYSQINPPLLSPHILVPKQCDPKMFVTDTMFQPEPGNDIHMYTLEHFHILNKKKRREESLISKMSELELWKSGREQLTDAEKFTIRNIVTSRSDDMSNDDKVYLGFTAYVHDSSTNSKIKYAETEFSSAIYDCSNSAMLHPYQGPRSGGSMHVLNVRIANSANIQVNLSDDNGWSACATFVLNTGDNITFHVPPYGGTWRDDDDTRVVNIKVLVGDSNVIKKPIKFLYKRN